MPLNVDIWLYILALVPLQDAVSFTRVSREFRSLTLEKSFWISLLLAKKASRPLPCPDDENLADHDIAHLKDMVFHVLRLERNWGRRRPDYLSMKTIRLGPGHRILHAVPGTPLLFVHSGLSGDVACWNVDTETALHSTYIGRSVFHVSLLSRHNKICSMALLVTDDLVDDYSTRPSYLVVITIQTASPSPIIEVPFRRPLEASFTFGQLFLNQEVVGLLRVFDMGRLEIVAFNRFNGVCRIIRTDTLYDRRMGAFLDGSLYVVNHRSDFSSNVYNCPSHFLPYNDSGETRITDTLKWDDGGIRFWSAVDANYVGLETWLEALGALSHTPFRGAALTTLHYINVDEEPLPSAINIRFWSFKDRDTPLSQRLHPSHSLNLRGMIATTSSLSRPPYLVANSDVSVLIFVSYDDGLGLVLVRYDPSTFSSAISHLDVPSPSDLASVSSVALDDHRGVVMFIEDDVLYSVSYA